MSKELKVGAILGLFVVGLGSWFYYSRSSGDEARPIPLNQSLTATTDSGGDAAGPAAKPAQATPAKSEPNVGTQAQRNATPTRRTAAKTPTTSNKTVATRTPTQNAQPGAKPPAQVVTRRKPSAARPQKTGAREPANKPTPQDSGALLASTAIPQDDTPKSVPARPVNRSATNNVAGKVPTGKQGAGTSKPANQPIQARPAAKYAVESGDSFARIAQKQYGSQKYTSFLIKANPQVKNPERLKIGQVLNVPPLPDTKDAAVAAKAAPRARGANERTYVVKANDSFFDIALAQLGDGGRWPEIYERNKDEVGDDPMNLKPGQVLSLPQK